MTRALIFSLAFSPLLGAAPAWAHGNLVEQAQGAGDACLQYMLTNEEKKLVRHFKSVLTELTGDEVFSVTITLDDARVLSYNAAGVDGAGDTFSWACTKK